MNGEHDHLPIKIVIPNQEDLHPPRAGRGAPRPFAQHCDAVRPTLLREIAALEEFFDPIFTSSNLPAVARVQLRDDAIAKSHRPDFVFDKTCPIIGGENFGELLISVQPTSVTRLKRAVETSTDERTQNDLGKIVSIRPYGPEDVLGEVTVDQFVRLLREDETEELKLRLFTHQNEELDTRILTALMQLAQRHHLPSPVQLRQYGRGLRLYNIRIPAYDAIGDLAHYVGAQSLSQFQRFTVSVQSLPLARATPADIPPPEPDREYPIVGLIDSGTDPRNSHLQAWVAQRDEVDVPPGDQNNEHGSLVAGLMINGRGLNHANEHFPAGKVRIVDVVAFPSTDIVEYVLLDTLHRVFPKYPNVKLWNMSFNSTQTCTTERFSSFAIAMDEIQDQYGITVVNSTGNFADSPAHPWRRPDLRNRDRIQSPGDSLRAITVGSQAHQTRADACADVGDPSPFTRKGPGAAFVPKPEITHFGGNCNRDFDYMQIGVISIDAKGNRAETIGTSFAAPLVTATAAHVAAALADQPSRNLIKGLLVHSAVLHSPVIQAEDLPYIGFGKPPSPEHILRCRPWEATLIFEFDLPYAKRRFHKLDFPMPPCLHKNGLVNAAVTMTLVYDPPVDPSDGAAYSQVNVDASLGTCWVEDGESEDYVRKILPYPEDFEDLFEKNMIEHGYKWSPVKVFRRHMTRIKPRATWRIGLDMHARKPYYTPPKQHVVLIVTIADIEKQRPVYDEVITMMNRVGWITQNLQLKTPARVRV